MDDRTDHRATPARAPEGFIDPQVGGFVGSAGPILNRIEAATSVAGFEVELRHCNPSGICHGGWLATFADVMLVRQALLELGSDVRLRTVSLAIDFLAPARRGEWVEGRARLVRATKTLAFLEGEARTAQGAVLRTNAVFSLKRSALPQQDPMAN